MFQGKYYFSFSSNQTNQANSTSNTSKKNVEDWYQEYKCCLAIHKIIKWKYISNIDESGAGEKVMIFFKLLVFMH